MNILQVEYIYGIRVKIVLSNNILVLRCHSVDLTCSSVLPDSAMLSALFAMSFASFEMSFASVAMSCVSFCKRITSSSQLNMQAESESTLRSYDSRNFREKMEQCLYMLSPKCSKPAAATPKLFEFALATVVCKQSSLLTPNGPATRTNENYACVIILTGRLHTFF